MTSGLQPGCSDLNLHQSPQEGWSEQTTGPQSRVSDAGAVGETSEHTFLTSAPVQLMLFTTGLDIKLKYRGQKSLRFCM